MDHARLLIEHGTDVTAVNNNGSTPLDLAAVKAGNVVLARLLADHAADMTARDIHGSTALDIEHGAKYRHGWLRRIRHRFLKVCQSIVSSSSMTQT